MPTYQYACTEPDCGNRFELVQSFTDPSASECPVCNGTVRKVYGSVGVVFKGSGFYRTDSRAGGSGESWSESKSESKSETKTETKSDTKTEKKSDTKTATTSDSKSTSSSSSTSSGTSGSSSKAAASA
ncbi:MAG TPA: FmdB family zinc ribbon protein [Jatrophihabitans sp.]